MIRERYPDHVILGEEFETANPDDEYQWVLDPIDGTKNFVSGTPLFGTLIALLKKGYAVSSGEQIAKKRNIFLL